MAIQPDLADIGIFTLASQNVFTRDVEFSGDVKHEGDLNGVNVTVTGDITILQARTNPVAGIDSMVLSAVLLDLSATVGVYFVTPTNFVTGYVSKVRATLREALSASDAVLRTTVAAVALDSAYDCTVAYGSPGDVFESAAIPDAAVGNNLAPGTIIRVYPSTPGGSAASCWVQVEITRT